MRYLIVLIIFIFCAGCAGNEDVPEGILPDSTMRNILVEISIADAAYSISSTNPSLPKFRPELFYDEIMKQHHTTREKFIKSMDFYALETERLQKIYGDALVEINERQAKASK